jgi:hypothetical protein
MKGYEICKIAKGRIWKIYYIHLNIVPFNACSIRYICNEIQGKCIVEYCTVDELCQQ